MTLSLNLFLYLSFSSNIDSVCWSMKSFPLTAYPPHLASFVFKMRGRSLSCRDNHHSSNKTLMCRLCGVDIETQYHILNCQFVRGTDRLISLDPYLKNNVPLDQKDELQMLKDRYDEFHELVRSSS